MRLRETTMREARWVPALGGLMGGFAASIASLIWGLAALFSGMDSVPLPLTAAALAGGFAGALSVFRGVSVPWPQGLLPAWLAGAGLFLILTGFVPWAFSPEQQPLWLGLGTLLVPGTAALMARLGLRGLPLQVLDRNLLETLLIRTLRAVGLLFFTTIVAFPFYFMVVTSLKSQMSLLANPIDLSLSLEAGWGELFRAYSEVWTTFKFRQFVWISTFVSLTTVVITLTLSILGAYAVARLRFPGRAWMARSILLIYMFPAIVLVIPLYSVFSQLGLRDSLVGLLIVYPASTLPVALYMLKGYFTNLPAELEEAGLMDGCSRLGVIWRITLPLSLPAIASVGLYVFMIAWNEFLFAFMFLDDPSIFTLPRGMVSLNSSEVPRQYLMAGAVMVTVPVMVLFFWFEKYLVSGLTAGSVKG